MATLTSKLIVSLIDHVTGPARGIGGILGRLRGQAGRTNRALSGGAMVGSTVRNMLAIGAGYVGVREAVSGTVGAAMKFEDAFSDVRKVVNGTPADLAVIRSQILDMSKTLPITAEGIADIFAAAGQADVPLNELAKFSEMAAKVSVAWDMTQGATGDALAKIKTQLGYDVDQIGSLADAINYLSNNSASAASDLVDFDKRVAGTGKMYGFSATQTLAFGSAMVASGAEAEVAATSFRNMGRALTIGERATKKQRVAFSKLGLDSTKTAKNMQKNALKTTLDVLDRIQKLPEWQRASIASALFGDEARALMPVINNSKELRRSLDMVADGATYAGSAFNEYVIRSQTASNALQLLWNKVKGVGIGIGDSYLPTVKEFALGVGDVLDSLNKRVGVLDQIKASMQGFLGGLGYGGSGGVRQMMNDLGDMLFGEKFQGALSDVDERVVGLARLSNRFREIGANVKEFAQSVADNPITKFLGELSGGGFSFMVAATGITILASAIGKLARAALFLTGITTAVSLIKGIAKVGGAILGTGGTAVATGAAGKGAAAAGGLSAFGTFVTGSAFLAAVGAVIAKYGPDVVAKSRKPKRGEPGWWIGIDPTESREDRLDRLNARPSQGGPNTRGRFRGDYYNTHMVPDAAPAATQPVPFTWKGLWQDLMKPVGGGAGGAPADVSLIGNPAVSVTGPVQTQPSGVQDVRVTNPPPVPNISVSVQVQSNASPQEIGNATAAALSSKLHEMSSGSYSDGAN
jgi:TP901 family phage tail tape measure protein